MLPSARNMSSSPHAYPSSSCGTLPAQHRYLYPELMSLTHTYYLGSHLCNYTNHASQGSYWFSGYCLIGQLQQPVVSTGTRIGPRSASLGHAYCNARLLPSLTSWSSCNANLIPARLPELTATVERRDFHPSQGHYYHSLACPHASHGTLPTWSLSK